MEHAHKKLITKFESLIKSLDLEQSERDKLYPFYCYKPKRKRKDSYNFIPFGYWQIELEKLIKIFEKIKGRKPKTFLDLGSGKGNILFEANRCGLEATGVEYNQEIINIFNKLVSMGLPLNKDIPIETIKADIINFIPDKEYDIVYFYRPIIYTKPHDEFIYNILKNYPLGQIIFGIGGVRPARDSTTKHIRQMINHPFEFTEIASSNAKLISNNFHKYNLYQITNKI